jgi:hypothetical protein
MASPGSFLGFLQASPEGKKQLRRARRRKQDLMRAEESLGQTRLNHFKISSTTAQPRPDKPSRNPIKRAIVKQQNAKQPEPRRAVQPTENDPLAEQPVSQRPPPALRFLPVRKASGPAWDNPPACTMTDRRRCYQQARRIIVRFPPDTAALRAYQAPSLLVDDGVRQTRPLTVGVAIDGLSMDSEQE